MKSTKYLLALILSLLFIYDSAFSQWTDLNPWNTAKITGIEIVDTTYFVATENGIWRSQDSMQTWQTVNQGLPSLQIAKLYAKNNVLLAPIANEGLYISQDFGNTWKISNLPSNISTFYNFDSDSSNIYLATSSGVYISTNLGQNWTGISFVGSVTAVKCVGNDMFCGTLDKGIYYSSNQGKNWEQRNSGIQNLNINSIDGNEQFLLATTEMAIYADIYLSSNKGISWTRLNKDFLDENLFTKPLTTAIVFDSVLYVRDLVGTIYKSTNLGKDWVHKYSTGNRYEFTYKLHNDILYMGTTENRILYHSQKDNNANEVRVLIAPYSKYIKTLHHVENNLLISSDQDISFSNNYGSEMIQNYFNYRNRNVYTSINNIVFTVNYVDPTFTLLYSTNKGEVWDTTSFNYDGGEILSMSKYQDTLYAISRFAYAYSTNNGKNWSQTIQQGQSSNFSPFLFSKDDGWYYLKNKDTNEILSISFDKGKTFIELVDISYLKQEPKLFHNGFSLYLNSSYKVQLVTNATNQLIDLTKNLPVIKDTASIRTMYVKNETVFCIVYNGKLETTKLYYLTDMNSQWQEFTNKENAILGSKLYADDKYLYSFDQRFYRTELSNFKSMSVEIDSQSENPVVISLTQDILSFNLANEINSSIEIYNSLGKTMYSQNGMENIDVSNFANGVYFVKIQTKGKTVVNKFVKY